MKSEQRDELLRKLRSIAASANDAQDHVSNIEELGSRLDDIQDDLNRAILIANEAA
jgi:hypothetical protein